jgi:hypothetical protein
VCLILFRLRRLHWKYSLFPSCLCKFSSWVSNIQFNSLHIPHPNMNLNLLSPFGSNNKYHTHTNNGIEIGSISFPSWFCYCIPIQFQDLIHTVKFIQQLYQVVINSSSNEIGRALPGTYIDLTICMFRCKDCILHFFLQRRRGGDNIFFILRPEKYPQSSIDPRKAHSHPENQTDFYSN